MVPASVPRNVDWLIDWRDWISGSDARDLRSPAYRDFIDKVI
jgi:hypothetical protein